MGRGDYILGKMQFIFWIPINLQNFWKCHHGGHVWFTCLVFTPQPLRAVGVLFSPMVSGWAGSGRAGGGK